MVELDGKFDMAGAREVDSRFSALAGSERAVIVDLSRVSFLASMGLRTLIASAKSMSANGGRMVLFAPTREVENLLRISGTGTLIPVMPDLNAAIAAVTV